MTEVINLEGVSAKSLTLLDEHVLVRAAAAEERRASGLWVPNAARESFGKGSEFYGVVVAVGPGRLVERGPSAEAVAQEVHDEIFDSHKADPKDAKTLAGHVANFVREFVTKHTKADRVPMSWKVGDHVMCRQGFGPEIDLREGRHHIVGRGNSDHGHGIIAAWDPKHVHCWHRDAALGPAEAGESMAPVVCACGAGSFVPTRYPACSNCPAGEHVHEAVVAGEVYAYKIGDDAPPGDYELRPEGGEGHEV